MTEPRPVREDLSDEALFGGPLRPQADQVRESSEQHRATVRTAIRVLLAANLSPAFQFNPEDAETLWSARLAAFDAPAILAAADEFVTAGEFPQLDEFEAVAASKQRARAHPGVPEREPGDICPECGSSDEAGFAYTQLPENGIGIATRVPCSLCKPDQLEMHRAGHFMPRETPSTCRCRHPLCEDTVRRKKAKASA